MLGLLVFKKVVFLWHRKIKEIVLLIGVDIFKS
jgi:hypothetical protein